MYGTVAKVRVKPENREPLRKLTEGEDYGQVDGYISSSVLYENDSDVTWLFVTFRDRASYDANANDPAQNERYMAMRALMDADPEWHDGEIESM
jgi:quinol monooxygenase YgiN